MDLGELTEELGSYPRGTVINLRWDRGNGELSKDHVYLGRDPNGIPILKLYREDRENVVSYGDDVSFEISNPEIQIIDFSVFPSKSYLVDSV